MSATTIAITIALCASTAAIAQFAIERETIDNGGDTLNATTYALSGTIAQPDANPPLVGASYALVGGFWPEPTPQPLNACSADFDHDGDVDLGDFGVFGGAFGSLLGNPTYNPAADFDHDNDIDLGDFGVFGGEFGRADCLD